MPATTRFTAAQLLEGVRRCAKGGDSRLSLIIALSDLDAEPAMLSALADIDLQASERWHVRSALVSLHPEEYLDVAVREGLRSSIGVQQMVIAELPKWAGSGLLGDELLDLAVAWVRRRLRNPRRSSTYALWEVPGVALALSLLHGPDSAYAAMSPLSAMMQPDEQSSWATLPAPRTDPDGFVRGLWSWHSEHGDAEPLDQPYADPTATRYVDSVMRRLSIAPTNPDVETFIEDWE